jgi:uncharacterized protein
MLDSTADFIKRMWSNTRIGKVVFHGGEPLTAGHAWFEYALDKLSSTLNHRARFSIQTNAWAMDETFMDLFAHYRVGVSVSLDGDRDLCDSQRGTGYFDKSMRGIRLLTEGGVPVSVIATIMPANIDAIPQIISFFEKEKLPFTLRGAVPTMEQGYANPQLYVAGSDSKRLYDTVLRFMEESPAPPRIREVDAAISGVFHGRSSLCTFSACLGQYLAIDPVGDVYPCQRFCGLEEYRLGTVEDAPDALADSPAFARLTKRHAQRLLECGDCKHLDHCNGGCAYSIAVADKYGQPNSFCGKGGQFYKALFDDITLKLAAEGEGVLLGEADRTPYLSAAGDRPHPGNTKRNRECFAQAYEWSKSGAPRHAFAYRERAGQVYLNITNNCSLRCAHCGVWAGSTDGPADGDMPLDTALSIIHSAHRMGFRTMSLNGGEPFLYKDLHNLLREMSSIRDINMNYALFTSLYPEVSDELYGEALRVFDLITISLDGDETEHDQRRAPGSFAKTCEHLRRLVKLNDMPGHSCALSLRATLTGSQKNAGVEQAVRKTAAALGIKRVEVMPVLPIGRARTLAEVVLRKPTTSAEHFFAKPFAPRFSCGLGTNLHITSGGDIYPCWAMAGSGEPLGNARDGLENVAGDFIWGEQSTKYGVSRSKKCERCDVKHLCGGVCIGYREADCSDLRAFYLALTKQHEKRET